MFNEAVNVLQEYGWAALFLFVSGVVLLRYISSRVGVWNARDRERTANKNDLLKEELSSHQLFANIEFKLKSEIPTLSFQGINRPVRQKIFRRLMEIKVECIKQVASDIIAADTDKMTPTQWSAFVQQKLNETDSCISDTALSEGIPLIVVSKFMVWRQHTQELLNNYVKDLAMSEVYTTNIARTNTLLFLMNLKLITIVGDAERLLGEINGELSGITYKGEIIE